MISQACKNSSSWSRLYGRMPVVLPLQVLSERLTDRLSCGGGGAGQIEPAAEVNLDVAGSCVHYV